MIYFYQFAIGIISSSFVVWLTTHLALKRFYNEKWWEKRASAFIEITEAVYHLKIDKEYHDDLKDFRREGAEEYPSFVELNGQQLSEMYEASSKARKIIKRYSQVGPLLITEKATKLLCDYVKAEDAVDFDVHFRGWDVDDAEKHILHLTQKLLEDLVAVSRKELKSA